MGGVVCVCGAGVGGRRGRSSGDKPSCPPVPQTTKKVSDVCLKTKSRDPPCFDVRATWDAGLHQHSGRNREEGKQDTHTHLVPRTNKCE